jgi:hypothetical protein
MEESMFVWVFNRDGRALSDTLGAFGMAIGGVETCWEHPKKRKRKPINGKKFTFIDVFRLDFFKNQGRVVS